MFLLGCPRTTPEVKYTYHLDSGDPQQFERLVSQLADEMKIDFEPVARADGFPLPPDSDQRRLLMGRFGKLDVYLFDLYTVALRKIARGFEPDLEDVVFLLRADLIEFVELHRLFDLVYPAAAESNIDPDEFRAYFTEVIRRLDQSF